MFVVLLFLLQLLSIIATLLLMLQLPSNDIYSQTKEMNKWNIELTSFTSNTFTSYCLNSKNKDKIKTLKIDHNHFIRKKLSLSFTFKYNNILPWFPTFLEHTHIHKEWSFSLHLHHTYLSRIHLLNFFILSKFLPPIPNWLANSCQPPWLQRLTTQVGSTLSK
jgi:hypothetical protein